MINIAEGKWQAVQSANEAQKLFIERWLELFNQYTIDSYRVRFHNGRTILKELLRVVQEAEVQGATLRHCKIIAEEAQRIVKADPVLKVLIKPFTLLMSELGSPKDWENQNYSSKRKYFLKGLIKKLDITYLNQFFNSLNNAFDTQSQKETIILTDFLASEVVAQGFSMKYLGYLGQRFISPPILDFTDKFEYFREKLLSMETTFRVVQKISFTRTRNVPREITGVNFNENIPVPKNSNDSNETNYLIKEPGFLYVECEVMAKDWTMASVKTFQKIERCLDIFNYGFPLESHDIHRKALVYDPNHGPKLEDNKIPILGYYKNTMDWFDVNHANFSCIFESDQIFQSTKDKIKAILRYIRKGWNSTNNEEKFLNFWIAFEFLTKLDTTETILDKTTEYPSKFMGMYYPRRILRDFLENFKRLDVLKDPAIRRLLFQSGDYPNNEARLLDLMRNQDATKEIIDCCSSRPLLLYRFKELLTIYGSSEGIRLLTEGHVARLKWHIARIYRFRNRIVHGAEHNLRLDQLTSNIVTYLYEILNETIYQLSGQGTWNAIEDLFLAYSHSYDIWLSRLKNDNQNKLPIEEVLSPVDFYL